MYRAPIEAGPPGFSLFQPESVIWRVNRESVLLIGGRAALLMQLAHPLVAAGVADHSDFRRDGIARLKATLDAMLGIVFGTRAEADAIAHRVTAVHARVRGIAPDGRPYSAMDPHLLLWVYSTLVDSSLRVYEACFGGLSAGEAERYYDETKIVVSLFGVPHDVVPPTLDDMRDDMSSRIRSGEVTVTPLARELADHILRPVPWMPRRLANLSLVVTPALLPEQIRKGYGLELGRSKRALVALGGSASRAIVPRIPSRLRTWPVSQRPVRSPSTRGLGRA